MSKIDLQASDYAEMRSFYEQELEKTVQRLQHIQKVLNSLGKEKFNIAISIEGTDVSTKEMPAKRGKKPAVAAGKPAAIKPVVKTKKTGKRGRASVWAPMIIDQLKKANKALSYSELLTLVMAAGNISAAKKTSTKNAISNVVFKLRNEDKTLTTIPSSTREKFIALSSWLDANGKLKDEFKSAAPAKKAIKVEVKKGKSGRPKKATTTKVAAATKGKPGRPKKIADATPAATSPTKGKQGRPSKSKAPAAPAASTKAVVKAGRPKKAAAPKAATKSAPAGKRGRPKKVAISAPSIPATPIIKEKTTKEPAPAKKVVKAKVDSVKKPAAAAKAIAKPKTVKKEVKPKAVAKIKVATPNKATKTNTVKSKAAAPKVAPKSKAGGKKGAGLKGENLPVWAKYVVDVLKVENKPLLVRAITARAATQFKIGADQHEKLRLAIARAMSQLEKEGKDLKRFEYNGQKPSYYALRDWYDTSGVLKAEYVAKINALKAK